MQRLLGATFVLYLLVVLSGCRAKQPLVLHVYRDRTSAVGRELDRRFYEFSTKQIKSSSGRQIFIATVEPRDYKQMLRDKVGKELLPELIVLNSNADEAVNPIVEREAAHAINICPAVRACPTVVPAFIPSWVSNAEELQAAQQVLNALRG